jgi:DNA polymerase-3 subunit epsilon
MRQIVLDTETTGLEPEQGHRIIEIGCVELFNRRPTGNNYHIYINPDREIDEGATSVHGISAEMLADKPRFGDVAADLTEYLGDAELVIHNAPFDVGFLNHEFTQVMGSAHDMEAQCKVLDTLLLARRMHPGQRNTLDALCKRYEVDNTQRQLHGALLDAQLLAEVYLAMTVGQTSMALDTEPGEVNPNLIGLEARLAAVGKRPPVLRATEAELKAHSERLRSIAEANGGQIVWAE